MGCMVLGPGEYSEKAAGAPRRRWCAGARMTGVVLSREGRLQMGSGAPVAITSSFSHQKPGHSLVGRTPSVVHEGVLPAVSHTSLPAKTFH